MYFHELGKTYSLAAGVDLLIG